MRLTKKTIQDITDTVGITDNVTVGYLDNTVEIDFGCVVVKFEHVLHDAELARIKPTKTLEAEYPLSEQWDEVTKAGFRKVMATIFTGNDYLLYQVDGTYLLVNRKVKTLRSHVRMTVLERDTEQSEPTSALLDGHSLEETEYFNSASTLQDSSQLCVIMDGDDLAWSPFLFVESEVVKGLDTDYLMKSVKELLKSPFRNSILETFSRTGELKIDVPYTLKPGVVITAVVHLGITLLTEYETHLTLLRHGLLTPLRLSRMYYVDVTVR